MVRLHGQWVRENPTFLPVQATADIRRIHSFSLQWAGIESAGGYLHLSNRAILLKKYLFRTDLATVVGAVCLSVVKDIPLSINTLHAAMRIA